MEKIDKFGLLWIKIFTTLFILGFFSYDIFYVLTFWKAVRPFCNDNIYDMRLQYVWCKLVEVLSDIYSVLFFFKVDWKQIGSRQASGNMAKYCESC